MHNDYLYKAKRGDTVALNYLIEEYKDLAYSIAFKYIGNTSHAEDIVQESFINIFLNIHKFKNEAKFSTWLFRIVYNESLKFLSKRKNIEPIDDHTELIDNRPISESQFVQKDRTEFIKEILQCLNANEHLIINLFYLMEKDIREITVITGQTKSNIKVVLHRARKKMANYLSIDSRMELIDLL